MMYAHFGSRCIPPIWTLCRVVFSQKRSGQITMLFGISQNPPQDENPIFAKLLPTRNTFLFELYPFAPRAFLVLKSSKNHDFKKADLYAVCVIFLPKIRVFWQKFFSTLRGLWSTLTTNSRFPKPENPTPPRIGRRIFLRESSKKFRVDYNFVDWSLFFRLRFLGERVFWTKPDIVQGRL